MSLQTYPFNDPLYGFVSTNKGTKHNVDLYCETCATQQEQRSTKIVGANRIHCFSEQDARYKESMASTTCWATEANVRIDESVCEFNPAKGHFMRVFCRVCDTMLGAYFPRRVGFYDPPDLHFKLTMRLKRESRLLLRMFWSNTNKPVAPGEFQDEHDMFDHNLSGPKKDDVETLEQLLADDTYGGELNDDELWQLIAFERELQKVERDNADAVSQRWRRLANAIRSCIDDDDNSQTIGRSFRQLIRNGDDKFVQQQAMALLLENLNRAVIAVKPTLSKALSSDGGELSGLFRALNSRRLLIGRSFCSIMFMFSDYGLTDKVEKFYKFAEEVLVGAELDYVTEAYIKQRKGTTVPEADWTNSIWRAMFTSAMFETKPNDSVVMTQFKRHPEWHANPDTQRAVLIKAKFDDSLADGAILTSVLNCKPNFSSSNNNNDDDDDESNNTNKTAAQQGELICLRAEFGQGDVNDAIKLLNDDIDNVHRRAALFGNICDVLLKIRPHEWFETTQKLFRDRLASASFWQPRALGGNHLLWIDLHFSAHIKVSTSIVVFALPTLIENFVAIGSLAVTATTIATWRVVVGSGKHSVSKSSDATKKKNTGNKLSMAEQLERVLRLAKIKFTSFGGGVDIAAASVNVGVLDWEAIVLSLNK